MLDVLNVDRRYCAQNVLVLTDIRYFQNLLQKSPVVKTFNRDGSGFITILLKFACLYDVIAIDSYLANITKK